jgi:hypothetical protein
MASGLTDTLVQGERTFAVGNCTNAAGGNNGGGGGGCTVTGPGGFPTGGNANATGIRTSRSLAPTTTDGGGGGGNGLGSSSGGLVPAAATVNAAFGHVGVALAVMVVLLLL